MFTAVPQYRVRPAVRILLLVIAVLVTAVAGAGAQDAEAPGSTRTIIGPPPPVLPEMVARDGDGRVTMRAVRIDRPLNLDGRLDEEIFQRVPGVSGFVQQEPYGGQPATEDTEFWVFFDDQNLYFAGRMWEDHPERRVANELRRDNFNIGQNDSFSVAIDTYYDRRSGYYFQTNSIGGLREALVTDERTGNNFDWNTVWNTRSAPFEKGWTSEMVIPFKSIRYRAGGEQIWSINVRRVVRWRNETSFLSPVPQSYGGPGSTRFNVAATLVGIEVPQKTRNLEVKPYAISQLLTNRLASPPIADDLDGDFGFDVKYGLTRSLMTDFTYNTDFAQVEDDEQQVNLTRFSQFFPERREFFLEGQGIFEFASVRSRGAGSGGGGGGGSGNSVPNEAPLLFFSRRIGLQNGRPTPIAAGGRLTGRAGRYTLGLLNIETGNQPERGVNAANFSVVRVRRDLLRRSNIGLIATNRSPDLLEASSNRAAGVDASFGFYDNVSVTGYYARTWSDGRNGDDDSYRGQADYNGDRYGASYELLKVGEDFNPEIGFQRRLNFRRNFALLRFSPRPRRLKGIRKMYYEGSLDYIVNNTDGRLQSRIGQGSFRLDLQNGDSFETNYNQNYEVLTNAFEISAGVFLAPAGYAFDEVETIYRLGPQRKFAGDLRVLRGAFYSGTRTEVAYSGRIEVTPRLSLEPRVSLTDARLPEGDFVTKLLTTRTTFTVTPRTFIGALLQYNSSTNAITANVRYRWEYRPGSDLFVVFTEGRTTAPNQLDTLQQRGFVVKYTRLLRF